MKFFMKFIIFMILKRSIMCILVVMNSDELSAWIIRGMLLLSNILLIARMNDSDVINRRWIALYCDMHIHKNRPFGHYICLVLDWRLRFFLYNLDKIYNFCISNIFWHWKVLQDQVVLLQNFLGRFLDFVNLLFAESFR